MQLLSDGQFTLGLGTGESLNEHIADDNGRTRADPGR